MDDQRPMNREQRRHPEKFFSPDAVAPDIPTSDPIHENSSAGSPDQDVTHNTTTGSGGAMEHGGGNGNHPSRTARTPGGGQRGGS
jgi:hypothetical protein